MNEQELVEGIDFATQAGDIELAEALSAKLEQARVPPQDPIERRAQNPKADQRTAISAQPSGMLERGIMRARKNFGEGIGGLTSLVKGTKEGFDTTSKFVESIPNTLDVASTVDRLNEAAGELQRRGSSDMPSFPGIGVQMDGMRANMAGAGEARTQELVAQLAKDEQVAKDVLALFNEYKRQREEAGKGQIQFTDVVDGKGDFNRWVGQSFGSGVASMAPLILAAMVPVAGPALAGAGAAAMNYSSLAGGRIDKGIDRAQAGLRGPVGTARPSAIEQMDAPNELVRVQEQLQREGAAIAVTTLGATALDFGLGPVGKAIQTGLMRSLGKEVADQTLAQLSRSQVVKDVLKTMGKQTVEEALNEGGQEFLSILLDAALDGEDIATAENVKKVINAAAAGAVPGAAFGGAQRGVEIGRARRAGIGDDQPSTQPGASTQRGQTFESLPDAEGGKLTPSGQVVSPEDWAESSERVRAAWMEPTSAPEMGTEVIEAAPAPTEEPGGEAGAVETIEAAPAPPEEPPRVAELRAQLELVKSKEARKVIQDEIDGEIKSQEAERKADELEAEARQITDERVRTKLLEQANKLRPKAPTKGITVKELGEVEQVTAKPVDENAQLIEAADADRRERQLEPAKKVEAAKKKAAEVTTKTLSSSALLRRIKREGGMPVAMMSDLGLDKSQKRKYTLFRREQPSESGPLFFAKGRLQEDKLVEIAQDMGLMTQAEAEGPDAAQIAMDLVRGELTDPGSAKTVGEREGARIAQAERREREAALDDMRQTAADLGIDVEGMTDDQLVDRVYSALAADWTKDHPDLDIDQAVDVREALDKDEAAVERAAIEFENDADEFARRIQEIIDEPVQEARQGRARSEKPVAGREGAESATGGRRQGESPTASKPAAKQAAPGRNAEVRDEQSPGAAERSADPGRRPATEQPRTERSGAVRRVDTETRRRVDQMTPEDMRRELLTNPVSGLPNRRAYDEAPKKETQASIDVDGLKWVNDNLGHESGDYLLRAVGEALQRAGVDAYHVSGDEFVAQATSPQSLANALNRARQLLDNAVIEGSDWTVKGVGFSYGQGTTLAEAEQGLRADKARREAEGQRAARGETPAGADRRRAEPGGEGDAETLSLADMGLYSALERAVGDLSAKLMSPSDWKVRIKALVGKNNVKADEIKWSGINEWLDTQQGKVTKEAVVEFLKGNGVKVEGVVLRSLRRDDGVVDMVADYDGEPKFGQYTLPGGTNYREVLLTLPTGAPSFQSAIQKAEAAGDAEGAVILRRVEMMAKERGVDFSQSNNVQNLLNGARQPSSADPVPESDRRQFLSFESVARAKGYLGGGDTRYKSPHWDQPNVIAHIRMNDRTDADGNKVLLVEEIQADGPQRMRAIEKLIAEGRATDADRAELERLKRIFPWATTDAWVALALKRILRMAAEGGYDKVAFVTGEQSAARYDLSKQISRVTYNAPGGKYADKYGAVLKAYDLNDNAVINKDVAPADLPDYIGKEVAQRLLESKPDGMGQHSIAGLDLKVGGEGMKAFYDKIVPKVLADVMKKVGGGALGAVQIESVNADAGSQKWGFERLAPGSARVIQRAPGVFQVWAKNERGAEQIRGGNFDTQAAAEQYIRDNTTGATQTQPAIDITPEMRAQVLDGLPLFKLGDQQARSLPALVPSSQSDALLTEVSERMSERFGAQITFAPTDPFNRVRLGVQAAQNLVATDIAQVLGVKVAWYQQVAGPTINGFSSSRNPDTVFVSINGKEPSLAVTGHEFLHALRKIDPALYDAFVREMVPFVRDFPRFRAILDERYRKYGAQPLAEDTVYEELMGDVWGDRFTEPEFYRELAKANPSRFAALAKRLINFITDILAKVRGQRPFGTERYLADLNRVREIVAKTLVEFDRRQTAKASPVAAATGWMDRMSVPAGLTDSPEFKRWFGDSKVVDAEGKPLVVYHGTKADFEQFDPQAANSSSMTGVPEGVISLSSSPEAASSYAGRFDEQGWKSPEKEAEGQRLWDAGKVREASQYMQENYGTIRTTFEDRGRVLPVYVAMKNPLVIDAGGASWKAVPWRGSTVRTNDILLYAKNQGHDGVIIRNVIDQAAGSKTAAPADSIFAFRPEQIKSAIGNRGTFDPNKPDITLSLGSVYGDKPPPRTPADPQGKFDKEAPFIKRLGKRLYSGFIDNLSRLQEVQKETGKQLRDEVDAYAREITMHGRQTERLKQIQSSYIEPIQRIASKEKLSYQDVSDYLYAKHAPEANAYIASVRADMPDGGSGLSNAAAAKILAGFKGEQKTALEQISKLVQTMNREKLDRMVEQGLITPQTRDELNTRFANFVSLKNLDDESILGASKVAGSGSGLEVKGKEFKVRSGRVSKAEDVLSMTIRDAMLAVVRSEKNRPAAAFARFVAENPNPALWRPVTEDNFPVRKERNADGQVVEYKDPGALYREPRFFGAKINGEQVFVEVMDEDLAKQLHKLGDSGFGPDIMGRVLAGINTATRTLSMLYTQLNVDFALVNPLRDVQQAVVVATSFDKEKGLKMAGDLVKAYPAALRAAGGEFIRGDLFGKEAKGPNAELFKQFGLDGGMTGGFGLMDAEQIQRDISRQLRAASGEVAPKVVEGARQLLKPVMALNDTLENMSRFAMYKVALENGFTRQQAAVMAKNVTVNFNKRGEANATLNALYAFFNASIQGNMAILRAIGRSRYAKAAALGLFMLGILQEMIGDDDDTGTSELDYVSEFRRDRSFVIPIGDDKLITVPLAYGLNVPFAMGRRAFRAVTGREDPAKAIGSLLALTFQTFSPIDIAGQGVVALAPTPLRPLVDVKVNEDFAGRQIAKENPFDTVTPKSEQYRDSANKAFVGIAKALNEMSGGGPYEKGYLDMSPEKMHYVFKQYAGGLAAPLDLLSLPFQEKVALRNIPVARRFVSERSPGYYRNQAFIITNEADVRRKQVENSPREPDAAEMEYLDEIRGLDRELSRLNRARNLAKKAGDDVAEYERDANEVAKDIVRAHNQFNGRGK